MKLTGKRALVTGGAVRVGQAITEALQAHGVEVVVHYRHSAEAAMALSPLTICADLSTPDACDELIRKAGPLDILINNAAVFHKDSLREARPDKVLAEFQINLFSPLQLIRRFAEQTGRGSVVNLLDRRVSSLDISCVPYSLAKKGLGELTRMAALEYAPGIIVNAVAPGPVLPPSGSTASRAREMAGNIPLKSLPSPAHIADAVIFLLESESITGQTLFVDGGQHLLGNGV